MILISLCLLLLFVSTCRAFSVLPPSGKILSEATTTARFRTNSRKVFPSLPPLPLSWNSRQKEQSVLFLRSPLDSSAETATSEKQKESDDLDSNSFGRISYQKLESVTAPVTDFLDANTDGWLLSYADLAPENASTLPGKAFLATNIGYAVAGLLLTQQGDFFFGFLTELCALASFNYHYWQLEQTSGGEKNSQKLLQSSTVKLALFIDYICAALSILTATAYLLTSGGNGGFLNLLALSPTAIPAETAIVVGLAFLGLSWKYESGKPYMIFHSLWHFFSAYGGYLIGTLHLAAVATSNS